MSTIGTGLVAAHEENSRIEALRELPSGILMSAVNVLLDLAANHGGELRGSSQG